MKKEVITLHIGQAGIQMGTALWELFLLEHCIGPDGYSTLLNAYEDFTFECFFEDVDNNRFVPRTVFVDTEPNVIDELKCGVYKNLFHPDQIISGVDDGANNFARGTFILGKQNMAKLLDRVRKSVEICEKPQAFMINHSFSGGTGSGLTSVILDALTTEYTKVSRIQIPIFPGPSLATAIVEPYNCSFHVNATMEVTDMAFLFDNEALYDICLNNLLMHAPNFTNINRIMALVNSALTCSMRFPGTLNADLTEIQTNLIPYPRIHFPCVSHVPLIHSSRIQHQTITMKELVKNVFSPGFQMVRCNLNRGLYMAVILNARGLISPNELNTSVHEKSQQDLTFVEWSPSGFKLCLNTQTPTIVPESEIAFTDKSLTMMCNSTAVRECWMSISRKFDLLFLKRAFVHWYLSEGMEESEFEESKINLEVLVSDYLEMTLSADDIVDEKTNQTRRSSRIQNPDKTEFSRSESKNRVL